MGLQSDSDFDADSESDLSADVEMKSNAKNKKLEAMEVDNNAKNEKGGGLIVEEKEFAIKEDSKMTKAKRWFSDNIFDSIETDKRLDEQQMNQEFGDLVEGHNENEKEEVENAINAKTQTPATK